MSIKHSRSYWPLLVSKFIFKSRSPIMSVVCITYQCLMPDWTLACSCRTCCPPPCYMEQMHIDFCRYMQPTIRIAMLCYYEQFFSLCCIRATWQVQCELEHIRSFWHLKCMCVNPILLNQALIILKYYFKLSMAMKTLLDYYWFKVT